MATRDDLAQTMNRDWTRSPFPPFPGGPVPEAQPSDITKLKRNPESIAEWAGMSPEHVDLLRSTNLYKMADTVYRAVTLPEDVRTGMVAPQSPEAIGRAADIGLTGFGAARAVPAEAEAANQLGLFAGRRAPGADLAALKSAKKLQKGGVDRNDIWRETGWGWHPVNKSWFFEIPDEQMASSANLAFAQQNQWLDRLNPANDPLGLSARRDQLPVMMKEAVVHEPLYRAQPDLADRPFFRKTADELGPGSTGAYDPNLDAIATLRGMKPDAERLTILHELQHALQNREKWSPGAGMREFTPEAYEAYLRNAGETEARNVETRADWDWQRRRDVAPWYSQDRPYELQTRR